MKRHFLILLVLALRCFGRGIPRPGLLRPRSASKSAVGGLRIPTCHSNDGAQANSLGLCHVRGGALGAGGSSGGEGGDRVDDDGLDGDEDVAASLDETLSAAVSTAGQENPDIEGGGDRSSDGDSGAAKVPSFFDDKVDMKGMQKGLPPRNSLHLSRKLSHVATGFVMAGLYQSVPRNIFIGVGTFCSVGLCALEVLRYKKGFKWINRIFHKFFGAVLRKHEMDGKFTGVFYYFAGVTLTAALFPPQAAVLGIAQLAIADPMASFFGRKTKNVYWSRIEGGLGGLGRNKGILGFLGGGLMCFPFNILLFKSASWSGAAPSLETMCLASLLVGLSGSFADLAVPTPTLSVPKVSSAATAAGFVRSSFFKRRRGGDKGAVVPVPCSSG